MLRAERHSTVLWEARLPCCLVRPTAFGTMGFSARRPRFRAASSAFRGATHSAPRNGRGHKIAKRCLKKKPKHKGPLTNPAPRTRWHGGWLRAGLQARLINPTHVRYTRKGRGQQCGGSGERARGRQQARRELSQGGVVHGSKGKGTPGGVPGELDQRSCIAAPRLRNPQTKTKANVPCLP